MGLISESENFHTRQHPSSCGTLTTGCDLLRLAGCRVLAFTCRDDPFQRSQGKWIWSHMNFKGPWSPPTLPGSKPVHSESYLQDPRNSGWNKNEPVPETIHQDMGGWCSRPENSEFPILFNPHHPTLQPLPSTNCNNIHRSPTIPNHPQPSSPPTPHPHHPISPTGPKSPSPWASSSCSAAPVAWPPSPAASRPAPAPRGDTPPGSCPRATATWDCEGPRWEQLHPPRDAGHGKKRCRNWRKW